VTVNPARYLTQEPRAGSLEAGGGMGRTESARGSSESLVARLKSTNRLGDCPLSSYVHRKTLPFRDDCRPSPQLRGRPPAMINASLADGNRELSMMPCARTCMQLGLQFGPWHLLRPGSLFIGKRVTVYYCVPLSSVWPDTERARLPSHRCAGSCLVLYHSSLSGCTRVLA